GMAATKSRAENRRRKKQRDETRFEQHPIRLIPREVLRRSYKRQITHETSKEHSSRPHIENKNCRSNQSDPANCHQHLIAGTAPQQGRGVPESQHSRNCGCDRLKIVLGGKKTVRADESLYLK